ncbi:O-antigen ligase C-terminal domain-containing protein [Salmonella enterica subsp. enterica serovar Uganda]|nr:hypothetical protein [Salmonella enterica]EAC1542078.1 hypothetical protein [Salmonella enterica subsp. enterica]EBO2751035.1 hypothetical protein [Salmonella enterica subsp. enterica serovar Agona]EDE1788928.1 hypothetical protein [Salmonella enterica subsp. enterica serovar Enteritidis]EEJ6011813.1 hypothetical protein [Salmonella enterica subsp. enterica serovar Meleagridis]EGC3414679.1 hypothetical protein [Salmonella enterica subsp. enterica serovar Uganda]EIE4434096.1 O-antigen ligas
MGCVLRVLTWRRMIFTGMVLCVLFLYLPWGYIFRTGAVIPEFAGWALMGILFLLMACSSRVALHFPPLMLAGVLLLALPVFWMPSHAEHWSAVCRVLAMLGGSVLLARAAAVSLTGARAAYLGWMVVLVALVCSLAVFLQVFLPQGYAHWLQLPTDGRPSGAFRQVNVMASFLATALSVLLWFSLSHGGRRELFLLFVLMFALMLCQSTTGFLGAGLVFILMTVCAAPRLRLRLVWAALALAAGILAGWLTLKYHGHGLVSHELSRQVRMWTWEATVALIRQHPLTGVGYGMFEGSFPSGLALAGLTGSWTVGNIMPHPHNEVLYWVSEGGLPATLGMLLLAAWGVRLFIRLWANASQRGGLGQGGTDALAWGLCLVPVLLHTQTEYPWYESPLHYLLVILFVGMALSRLSDGKVMSLADGRALVFRGYSALAGVGIVVWSLTGTWVAVGIDHARQTMARDVSTLADATRYNPWFMPDAAGFAMMLHSLQTFNSTHDLTLLPPAEDFLRDYLIRHPDPNVYSMYITALHFQGKTVEAERVYEEGQKRVPWDRRFTPDAAVKDTDSSATAH